MDIDAILWAMGFKVLGSIVCERPNAIFLFIVSIIATGSKCGVLQWNDQLNDALFFCWLFNSQQAKDSYFRPMRVEFSTDFNQKVTIASLSA